MQSSKIRIAFVLLGALLLGACGATSASSQSARSLVTATATQQTLSAYITGYSYWDNTPPGSTTIALPVVHRTAGGQGTYDDPITLAVGHAIVGGSEIPDVPAGTRFYLQNLKKYAIVEDVCGDGPNPQSGPCHTGHDGHPWFDLYVGGEKTTAQTAAACENSITQVQTVIMNPAPNLPVAPGSVTDSSCRTIAQSN